MPAKKPATSSILAGETTDSTPDSSLGTFAASLAGEPVAPGWKWPSDSPYRTPLSESEEQSFQSWVKANRHIPVVGNWRDVPHSDYDMRGYWKDMASKGGMPTGQSMSDGLHLTDRYKTPYHDSFSRQSQYSDSDGPDWQGSDDTGWKLIDKTGRVVSDQSKLRKVTKK